MRRVVSVFLPTWSTDLWRRRNAAFAPSWDRPLAIVATAGPRRVLVAVDGAARRLGLRPGLAVAHAQAAIPDLTLAEAEPEEDAAALATLGQWCLRRFTPLVALDPPEGLWLDVAGAAHLHGGEEGLLAELATGIERRGIRVRTALAGTPGAAWAVARFGPGRGVVPPGSEEEALADLPVRALRLPPDVAAALAQLGIDSVRDLAATPRGPLQHRFGGAVTGRIDAALGLSGEPLAYLDPPDMPRVALAFAEPISTPETLAEVAERLLGDLGATLERRTLGARRLDLLFRRTDGIDQAVRVATARPTRSVPHVLRLFAERLGYVDPGFGIDEATLVASETEWFDDRQAVFADERGEQDLSQLVDRLVVRFGPARVFRAAPVDSGIPERSVARVPPSYEAEAEAEAGIWPAGLVRPAKLFTPPRLVTAVALAPDGPPAFFVWDRVRIRVARADGPERIHGEWWVAEAEAGLVRDYYRVETPAGDRFWLFRDAAMDEGGRWWLHGIGEA